MPLNKAIKYNALEGGFITKYDSLWNFGLIYKMVHKKLRMWCLLIALRKTTLAYLKK